MNLQYGEKILTINAELDPNEEVKVLVALPKASNMYGNYETPSDIDVTLFEEGIIFDKLGFQSNDGEHGIYVTSKPISANKEYHIKATYKDYKIASATQRIPDHPQIENISFNKDFLNLNIEDTVSVKIELLADSIGEKYYAMINYLAIKWNNVDSMGNVIGVEEDVYRISAFDKTGGFNDYRKYWTKEILNSNIINYKLALTNTDLWKSENILSLKLIINVEEISKDAYLYRASYRKRNVDNYGEPSIVYSNIDNGIGIFSSKALVQRIIKIF
ncbi:MAG: DUF4249 domain-containing protein [Chitinophagales bacterium]|nr:DUF4249 domain-containing protein [Chitinophagales bacterium]